MSHAVATPKGAVRFSIALAIIAVIALVYEINTTQFALFKNPSLDKIHINATQADTSNLKTYQVTRVIDGDTFVIDYAGKEDRVRLIGINTPETVDPRKPVQCFGKEASNKMKSLAQGQMVGLEFDTTQNYRDIYGRLLAYAYLPDGEMLNRKMLADGYAYEYTYMKPYKYQSEFKELQKFAEQNKRGLWADSTCQGQLNAN